MGFDFPNGSMAVHSFLCCLSLVYACLCSFEKRRRISRQDSDGDGGAGESKERTTKADVVG